MPKSYNLNWEELIKDQISSGMNMKQYCLDKGLPYHSFKNHKYAYQEKKEFIPVKQGISRDIHIAVNGNQISFDSDMDDMMMSRILKAMLR